MQIPMIEQPQIIGDPVHGYIPLTDLEYEILQLPTMLRLHYIKQTATAYLTFPGSVTTRFSHVVGALYMGDRIIRRLLASLSEKNYEELFGNTKLEFIIKCIRLACLFHDVGHGPFSHSAEGAMYKITKSKHPHEISEAKKLFLKVNKKIIHEYFSYKLITSGEIKKTIESHNDGCKEMIEFVSSLIVKTPKIKHMKKHPLGFPILRQVVSSQLDADRMDYLLRDSLMSGVKFGQTDVSRIINNMAIIKGKLPQHYEIAINGRALGNVEDMLDARLKMYKWYYNHHTVTGTNALIENAIDMMLKDKPSLGKLFHWRSYSEGESTDDYILAKLIDFIKTKSKYLPFKGLMDRRFLPISIFKQPLDYKFMMERIKKWSGKHEKATVIMSKIDSFFNQESQKKLEDLLEKARSPIKNTYVFTMNFPRTPYSAFEEDDRIFFYSKTEHELRELTTVSDYAIKINEEWKDFPSLYIYYVIPGVKKGQAQKYQKSIRNIISKAVALS